MKATVIKRLYSKYLSDSFSAYQLKGHLLYQISEGLLLKGFSFDSSGFDKNALYLQGFVQPLYIPDESVSYFCGDRIFSGSLSPENELEFCMNMKRQMLLFEKDLLIPMIGVSSFLRKCGYGLGKQYFHHEALVYGYILNNNPTKAKIALLGAITSVSFSAKMEPELIWYKETLDRLKLVQKLLSQNPSLAIEQILTYRDYTLSQLKLDPLR